MAIGNAYKDTNALFGRSIELGRGKQLANIFKDKKYMERLTQHKLVLQDNQKDLNELYKRLEEIFEKGKFNSSILDQLIEIMENEQGILPEYTDLRELVNNQFNNYSQGQQRALTEFLQQYWKTKDDFLRIADEMETTNIGLLGGNIDSQYYSIFLHNIKKEVNDQPMDKLIKMTREQYDQFEKTHPELFTRTSSGGYSLKQGISTQDIYDRMLKLFPEENGFTDILDQVYAQTNKGEQKYSLKIRDVYNILRKGGNLISNNMNSPLTKLSEITQSRRLEMLFDQDLITGIQKVVESKEINSEGKMQIKRQEIQNIIKNLDFNKYKGENIYGGVAGDVQLLRNGVAEDYQLKYKYGDWAPWNGRNYGAVINNINAYLDTGQKFIDDPTKMNDLALDQMAAQGPGGFFDFIQADAQTEQHFEEIGYEVVEDYFLTEATGETIEIVV